MLLFFFSICVCVSEIDDVMNGMVWYGVIGDIGIFG